jgi:uncharacterized membrane protein YphA (DoxX/SURF4 family)
LAGAVGRVRFRLVAGHLGRITLGLIFLVAGALKVIDPVEFARQMSEYGIIGRGLSDLGAPILIAFELTLALALIVGVRPRRTALVACGLLVFFIAAEGYGLSQGRTEACGCFGAHVQRTPQQVIVEDLLFIGLALLSLWGLRHWRGASRRRAAVVVAAGGLLALSAAIASPSLPIDSLVTALEEGRSLEEMGIAETAPGLGQGRHLVALIDVADPDAADTAARLDALAIEPGAPGVIALTPATEEERLAFTLLAYPEFDVYNVDRPVLKRLYRRLPRFFLIEAGRVVALFDDAVPESKDLLSSEAR